MEYYPIISKQEVYVIMNRKQGILAAGSLTTLVLVTMIALGQGGPFFNRPAATNTGSPTAVQGNAATSDPVDVEVQAQIEEANQVIAELETTLETMKQREEAYRAQLDTQPDQATADEYQAQLEAASQTIAQLEALLQTMQSREDQYQSQIETANQTILQLQAQQQAIATQQAVVQQPSAARSSGEHEDEEHEEYEGHEEHEEYDDD